MALVHQLWEDVLTEKNLLLHDLTNLKEHLCKDFENVLARPEVILPLFGWLREHEPTFNVGDLAIVSRFDDVLEVTSRDADFSVTEIYQPKMIRTTGPFVLGMADTPKYRRDKSIMERVVRPNDLEEIRRFVGEAAGRLVEAGVRAGGMDVVAGLSRAVPSQLVGRYFGAPGPDQATQERWMRAVFRDIFLNLTNDGGMRAEADVAAAELHAYLDARIAELRARLIFDRDASDDYLSRLVKLGLDEPARINDTLIRELIGGIIVGTVDTNSKAIAHVIDQLLDRPTEMRLAREAARSGETVFSKYVFEALRFNPQNPFLLRHCVTDAVVAAGTNRERTIDRGSLVIVGTWAAMFDPEKVPDPQQFRVDRPDDAYLHFGHGQHTCFGRHIAGAVIPEVVKALLKGPRMSRAPGGDGQIRYDGAFPDRLIVRFDLSGPG